MENMNLRDTFRTNIETLMLTQGLLGQWEFCHLLGHLYHSQNSLSQRVLLIF